MPELPEVETVRNGLKDILIGQTLQTVHIYQEKLRYCVPQQLKQLLPCNKVLGFDRRAKYLLLRVAEGSVLIHLGMSGSLRWLETFELAKKHDHVDFVFEDGGCLRFHDPRRFGLILWHPGNDSTTHRLLKSLGPEPLTAEFNATYLYEISRNKRRAIKTFLMDNHIVVGVGNIYANEALFQAGIAPQQHAGTLTIADYNRLVKIIKQVLAKAIEAGGTTLQDFVNGHGSPGYFQQQLFVYGREGQACFKCKTPILNKKIGQRSSFYCPLCQPERS